MNTIALDNNTGNQKAKAQHPNKESIRKILLVCGIISSIWYVFMNIYVPRFFPGYDSASQTVSELSAIGAPSRQVWNLLAILYTLLVIGFGLGVWKSAFQNRPLRIAGGLLMVYGALGIFWPFASMHLRETLATGGGTWTDTMHIVLAVATEMIYLFALGFAAAALGKGFRMFSIITFITLLVFGILTFLDAPGISTNQPTPMLGIWERINIGIFLVWMIVLAVILLPGSKSDQL